jgi:hypothetical protein
MKPKNKSLLNDEILSKEHEKVNKSLHQIPEQLLS